MRVRIYFKDGTTQNNGDYDCFRDVKDIEEVGSYTVIVRDTGERDVRINTDVILKIYTYGDNE